MTKPSRYFLLLLLLCGFHIKGQTCDFVWGDYAVVIAGYPLSMAINYCSVLTRSGTNGVFPTSVDPLLYNSLQSQGSVCNFGSPVSSGLLIYYTDTTSTIITTFPSISTTTIVNGNLTTFITNTSTITLTTLLCPVLDPTTAFVSCTASLKFICVFNTSTTTTTTSTSTLSTEFVPVFTAVTTTTSFSTTSVTTTLTVQTTSTQTELETATTVLTVTNVNVITELETETTEITEVDNTDIVVVVSLTTTTSVPTTKTVVSVTSTTATRTFTYSQISTLVTCLS